jgi:16S rRNA (guanine1207-N2)-methyltransferase
MTNIDSYYHYQQVQAEISDQTVTFMTRGALGKWQDRLPLVLLLDRWVLVDPSSEVLHMHCGDGLAGLVVSRQLTTGQITMLDCHIVAVETARRTLLANEASNAQVILSDCAQAVTEHRFGSIIALLPKGRAVWEQTILDAAALLDVGGVFYLAGANDSGIRSAAKYMDRVFGNLTVLGYKGGCRVLRAVREESVALPSSDYYVWRTIRAQVGDETLEYATKPGLFSWERLDDGTRLLIETLHAHPLHPDDQVLDMGCGSGILSLVAARQARAGHVVGVDADCRAVEATRRTLEHNQLTNASPMISDCGWSVRDRSFTAVITNPPFHRERATTYLVAEQIIRDAARLLQRRGRLYLVANSFLRYQPILEDAFDDISLLCQTNRFKVWYAVKRR